MTDHDLNWFETNLDNWDAPNAPQPAPAAHLYDAAALEEVVPVGGGATRDTVTCPACLCKKRKQKQTSGHTLIWGECLHATPPPPVVVAPMQAQQAEQVEDDEEEEAADEPVVSAVRAKSTKHDRRRNPDPKSLLGRFVEHPHACLAMSDVATWGSSAASVNTDTDVPSSSDHTSFGVSDYHTDDELEFDDDFVVHGGAGTEVAAPEP